MWINLEWSHQSIRKWFNKSNFKCCILPIFIAGMSMQFSISQKCLIRMEKQVSSLFISCCIIVFGFICLENNGSVINNWYKILILYLVWIIESMLIIFICAKNNKNTLGKKNWKCFESSLLDFDKVMTSFPLFHCHLWSNRRLTSLEQQKNLLNMYQRQKYNYCK